MDYKLQGDKVLIQLIPFSSQTQSETGLPVINWAVEESDSGRPKAIINEQYKYQDRGTVLQISPKALTTMAETHPDVVIGSTVWINHGANSPHFQFLSNKESQVQEFTGLVAVHTGHIEAVEV